jgi:hypothetical protein
VSIFIGFFRFSIFGYYSYACWVGSAFIERNRYNERTHLLYSAGDVYAIVFAF